jgi:hypothetical protein
MGWRRPACKSAREGPDPRTQDCLGGGTVDPTEDTDAALGSRWLLITDNWRIRGDDRARD